VVVEEEDRVVTRNPEELVLAVAVAAVVRLALLSFPHQLFPLR
jgi:hypothetical protein